MVRLLVHVEGQTEETFVNELLAPHLYRHGFSIVSPRLLGHSRRRKNRGGIVSWAIAKRDLVNHLREDVAAFATTFVDFYGLPSNPETGWPGKFSCVHMLVGEKADHIHNAMSADLLREFGQNISNRFLPFVMMHEFESLLFSDPVQMANSMERPDLGNRFSEIRRNFQNPEHINDSQQTAPSKRITELFPGYEKPLFGNLAALEISLQTMRNECPSFANWLTRLEQVPERRQ